MAEHGAWELLECAPGELAPALAEVDCRWVLADSLFLTPELAEPFLELRRRGARVAVMLHALPSRIASAQGGRAPAPEQTAFELAALEELGVVVTVGPYYHELLSCRGIVTLVCEPGVDDAWRAAPRARPSRGPCELVSVGAVTPLKGFLDVLDALEACTPEAAWRWSVVGSLDAAPDYAARLLERARRSARVTLAGQLSPAQAREVVQRAHVLVLPSYEENHPLVVLEAQAASVPCVGYAVGATPMMIAHGISGFLARVGDTGALGRRLADVIDDESRRYQMARACWQRQRELPSWRVAAAAARSALLSLATPAPMLRLS